MCIRDSNYPGLPGISGMDLGEAMGNHAEKLGIAPVRGKVLAVENAGSEKIIRTKKHEYRAKTVVLACGASHRTLDIPGEAESVSYTHLDVYKRQHLHLAHRIRRIHQIQQVDFQENLR